MVYGCKPGIFDIHQIWDHIQLCYRVAGRKDTLSKYHCNLFNVYANRFTYCSTVFFDKVSG